MNKQRFTSGRFHTVFCGAFCLILLLTLYLPVSKQAVGRDAATQLEQALIEDGLVDAVVTDVQGSILTLEGGIMVDASHASIYQYTSGFLDISAIKPGTCIRAGIVMSNNSSAPFVASTIRIRVPNEVVLTGELQQVEVEVDEYKNITGGFITLLNRSLTLGPLMTPLKRKQLQRRQHVAVVVVTDGNETLVRAIFPDVLLTRIFP